VVFSDAALQEMAFYLPQSPESFAAITGVGDAKLATYGDLFVEDIGAYAAESGLSERPPPPTRSRRSSSSGGQTGSTHEATKALILEGLNVGEIAQRRGLSQQTVLTHLERLVASGERLELDHLMPSEHRFRRIEHAFRAVGGEFLTPVRDYLGEGFSFEEIRLVRLRLSQDGE
jgi:ATP-dependent DNA helicase RecQ